MSLLSDTMAEIEKDIERRHASGNILGDLRLSPPPSSPAGNDADDDPLDFAGASPNEVIERINSKYLVLTDSGTIYSQKADGTLTALGKEKFGVALAGRTVETTSADGEKKQCSAADFWLRSRKRREFSGIGYWPNNVGMKHGHMNLFRGWGDVQPCAGSCAIITDHVFEVLANRDTAKADYDLDYVADILQNPTRKPGTVPSFRSDEGTGKTVFWDIVRLILGEHNTYATSDSERILGRFCAPIANKLLLIGEELVFAGSAKQSEQLKHLITGRTFQVEYKSGDQLELNSCHRLVLIGNPQHMLYVSARGRRYVMHDVSEARIGDYAYFAPLFDIAEGRDPVTLGAFKQFLLDRDLSKFKPWEAARNFSGDAALKKQKRLSLSPPLQWLDTIVDGADGVEDTKWDTEWSKTGVLHPWRRSFPRSEAIDAFRAWANHTKARGASDYAGSSMRFWSEIYKVIPLAQTTRQQRPQGGGNPRKVIEISLTDLVNNFDKHLRGESVM